MSARTLTLLVLLIWLTGCQPSATSPAASPDRNWIEIQGVQVQHGAAIIVEGDSNLPDGSCLQTELEIDGRPAAWWPATCVPVQQGGWRLQVPLERDGAPAALDNSATYVIHAWQQDHPSLAAEPLWFDLSGPPAP